MGRQKCGHVGIGTSFQRMGEISIQFGWSEGADLRIDHYRVLALSLVAKEPKEPILPTHHFGNGDGPAHGYAELIAYQSGDRRIVSWSRLVKEIIGVEILVPQIVVKAAVNVVRAGLRNDVHDAAVAAPVLGRVIISQNPELADCVGVR